MKETTSTAAILISGVLALVGICGDIFPGTGIGFTHIGHLYPLWSFLCVLFVLFWMNAKFRSNLLFWFTALCLALGALSACAVGLFANPLNWALTADLTPEGSRQRTASNVAIIIGTGCIALTLFRMLLWVRKEDQNRTETIVR